MTSAIKNGLMPEPSDLAAVLEKSNNEMNPEEYRACLLRVARAVDENWYLCPACARRAAQTASLGKGGCGGSLVLMAGLPLLAWTIIRLSN